MPSMHRLAFWFLLLFVFAVPWERNVAIPGIGAAGTPFGAIALLFAVAASLDGGRMRLRPPSVLLIVMGAFLLWSSLGYFWAIQPTAALGRSVTYVQLFVMVWLVWQLTRSRRELLQLMQSFVLGSLFAIVVVLVNFARGNATFVSEWSGLVRFSFAGGDPNYFALALVMALPMAWLLVLDGRGRFWNALNMSYIPMAVIVVGLTGSRGGVISALVALAIIPITYWHLGIWRKLALLVAMAAMAFGALFLIPEVTIERFANTPDAIAQDSLAGRIEIWQAGLEYLADNDSAWLVGIGSANFRFAMLDRLEGFRTAHNAYLNILVDNGLIGLLLFCSFFTISLIPSLTDRSFMRVFVIILLASVAVGIFGLSWEREKALWLALAIVAAHRAIVVAPRAPTTREKEARPRSVALDREPPQPTT